MSVVIVSAVIVTACGGSATGSVSEGEADPTTPPAASSDAQATATGSVAEDAGTLPAGVFIGTPRGGEPVIKEQQAGPGSTTQTIQQTIAPSQLDADGDGLYTFSEFQQAILALYPSYEWPDNYQIDPTTLLDGYPDSEARGDHFEVLGEYTIIGGYHTCAWEMAWLDGYREGDEALMAESLSQLREVALKNPLTHSSSLDYLKEIFERAELGDPAMLQQYVDSNCRRTDFIAPDTATPSGTP